MRPEQSRTYERTSSLVFLKTHDAFGGLSNMAGGFPLRVNRIRILTSEALYQACRFPHRPEVQTLIIEQASPMTAKMKSKPYRHDSRADWDQVRVKIMRWCLRVKLAQNWIAFSKLLLETGERPIVEESRKDSFWGAKANHDGTLVGMNVLGRLLMELRETIKERGRDAFMSVEPLVIPDFLLASKPIETVVSRGDVESGRGPVAPARGDTASHGERQPSLFGESVVSEAPTAGYLTVAGKKSRIGDLKFYPEYRIADGGWIGEIPSHWTVRRMKYVVREVDSRSTTGKEQLLRVSQYTGVTQRRRANGLEDADTRADSLVGYKRVEPNDLVVNIMLAWNGSMGISRYAGITSPAYCVYRFGRDLQPWYFHNLLRSPVYKARIKASSTGVVESRLRLYSDDLGRIEAIVPPPDEQAGIVRFLDWANWRLERAIRAKRKVIALLNEQKQALIHRAVTRGLDPLVPLKPSGIPWIGDIPQHWEVSRVKNEFRCLNTQRIPLNSVARGAMTSRTYDYYGASGVIDKVDDYLFDDELLLIAEDGANLVLRNLPLAIIATGKFWVNNHAHILKPRRGSIVYLAYVLEALNYQPWISGAAQPKLTQDRLMAISIAVAPPAEQATIIKQTSEQTRPLVIAIFRLEREIELLREYRTRLVADVVTGKLDVREAAARLPDDMQFEDVVDEVDPDDPDPESLDEEAAA